MPETEKYRCTTCSVLWGAFGEDHDEPPEAWVDEADFERPRA